MTVNVLFIITNPKGPKIEPVTTFTRTSVGTATVDQVECSHFLSDSDVCISYYDKEDFLGEFSVQDENHHLTNLNTSSDTIQIKAVDGLGNIAETTFDIGHIASPRISYTGISRTPGSVEVRGVQLYDFPMDDEVTLVYSCEGHEDISYTWEQDWEDLDHVATDVGHKLPGYGHSWQGGILRVIASCRNSVHNAESEIRVEGPGKFAGGTEEFINKKEVVFHQSKGFRLSGFRDGMIYSDDG